MTRIPVRNKGVVVGYALVDDADAPLVTSHRWLCSRGYASRTGNGAGRSKPRILMHRLILGLGKWDGVHEVDHLNHNKLDNRRENLRVVTRSVNQHNRLGPNARTSALPLGVYWMARLRKFKAEITVENTRHYLGLFLTAEAATHAVESFRTANGLHALNTAA